MKPTFGLILLLIALSCTSKKGAEEENTSSNDIPEGATVTVFSDDASLASVELKNSAGNVSIEGLLLDNKRSGSWVEYFQDGKIHKVISYVAGEMEGPYMEFNESGLIEVKSNYHNGKRNGSYREYNNGVMKEESNYMNGHLEGAMKKYYDDANLMEESNYKNGTMDGIAKWYDETGKVTIQYEYKGGKLIKK